MSYLLELLSKGLEADVGQMLDRHFRPRIGESPARLRDLCDAQPDQPEIRYRLGLAYLHAMRFADAAEHLSEACRRKPDLLSARLGLAAAFDGTSQSEKALEQLQIANQIRPGLPQVLMATGYCLEKLARSDEAAEFYRDVIAGNPDNVPARQRLAAIAILRENPDEAIQQYEHIRRLDPADSNVRAMLAHLYYRGRRYDDAIREFGIVIAMEPDNWALMDDEVEALVQAGQIREAAERLDGLIKTQGPFADLHLRLADLLSEMGDDKGATAEYLSALKADPDYIEAMIRLAGHHLNLGRWAESAEMFHQAAEINDRTLSCYVGLGVAQAAAGQPGQAIETFQLAAAIEPNSTLLLSEMARLQLKAAVAEEFNHSFDIPKDGPPESDLDHDDLLQLQVERHAEEVAGNPEYADLRYRYAVLLRAEGRLGEAQEQFAQAVRINPVYVDALIRLGITQQELGQIDQAIETFKKVLELNDQYVDMHYRLALLQTDRRQFEEAVKHMEKAAHLAPENGQVRAALSLALQNMGLVDRVAATWRSLSIMHAKNRKTKG